MCLVIYLATDAQLPVGDETAAALSVRLPKRKRVRAELNAAYVYEIGAHTGCGCGFLTDGDDSDEAVKTSESRTALRSYVEQALQSGEVELLVCWGGDENKAARTLVMSPEQLVTADFDSAWDQPIRIEVRPDSLPAAK